MCLPWLLTSFSLFDCFSVCVDSFLLDSLFLADLLTCFLQGMGPDGHTASLFPNHELLHENELLVASISDSPKLPPKRITLTYPVLNGARNVLFVAAGGSKAENLPKVIPPGSTMSNNGGAVVAINGGAAADTELLPAARVRPSAGSLHFYVDEDAASLLAPTTSDL